jgi:hypothetical protein
MISINLEKKREHSPPTTNAAGTLRHTTINRVAVIQGNHSKREESEAHIDQETHTHVVAIGLDREIEVLEDMTEARLLINRLQDDSIGLRQHIRK